MIRFPINKFLMAEFAVEVQHRRFAGTSTPNDAIAQSDKDSLLFDFDTDIAPTCEFIGLSHSLRIIGQITEALKARYVVYRYHEIATQLATLLHTMQKEVEEQHFAFIPSAEAPFFEQDELFGKAVNNAFPSIAPEIKDAGNCLAAQLNTAAVFHVMRVMEFGLQRLYKRLGLPTPKNPNWSALLNAIDNEIEQRDNANPRLKTWSKQREFYVECARHFRFFREMRNHAVHVEYAIEKYVPPDVTTARRIFEEVKHFMQHLATKLKE